MTQRNLMENSFVPNKPLSRPAQSTVRPQTMTMSKPKIQPNSEIPTQPIPSARQKRPVQLLR